MLRHYLKIAVRNIIRRPGISLINIAGLSIGIACCLLIMLFVTYELSFDSWNPNADRIVRPHSEIKFGGNHMELAVTGAVVGPQSVEQLPEIEAFCRIRNYGGYLIRREGTGQVNFREDEVLHADSNFFAFFPSPLVQGDPATCLQEPNSVAISVETAKKYFGSAPEAFGQTLVFDEDDTWQVTAVYEAIPANTHFQADFICSLSGNREIRESPALWAVNNNFVTYFMLGQGQEFAPFKQKFVDLSRQKLGQTATELMGMSLEEFEASGQYVRYGLQRLKEIHLHSDLTAELAPNGSVQYVWIFGAIALFILLIACINFMNLATARSAHRAREIGIRKVLGSTRSALIRQFLGETTIMTTIAIVIAVIISVLALPWFSELTTRDLSMPWSSLTFWGAIVAGILVTGLLAGSYPAFFLSAFESIKVLKGHFLRHGKHRGLRNGLVVFQFASSIVLIIATGLVYSQLNYIQNKQLGFNKDQVIILEDAHALGHNIESFKQQMLSLPEVSSASISSFLPVPSSRNNTTYTTSRELRQDNAVNLGVWNVDHDYLATMGMEMREGRFFDKAHPSDSMGVIINETAARNFGFENPVGSKVYTLDANFDGKPSPEQFVEYTVLGVVKDFHWSSLRNNIGSLVMHLRGSNGLISFRYQGSETTGIINALESNWKRMASGQPFSYRFMDESFANIYRAERRIGTIALIFAVLAIFVSCLGLFGLASFMAEQRTKEIGIRKVLGATTASLLTLMSRDFMKLVLIALVIGAPVAWYFMEQWLASFSYRIDIQWWIFLGAGLMAIVIAFLTVSSQSLRAALANPVDSLRRE